MESFRDPPPRWRALAGSLATMLVVVGGVGYGWAMRPGPLAAPKDDQVRVISWNLRNFPVLASERGRDPPHDLERLAAEFSALRPDVAAFQEIRDPARLGEVIGQSYQWVRSVHGGPRGQHLVLAWRRDTWVALGPALEHDALSLGGAVRPGFSQRLGPVSGRGRAFTILTVHLKARPMGASLRRGQWKNLALIAKRITDRDGDLVVLGDFNVTGSTPSADGPKTSGAARAAQERDALEQQLWSAGLAPIEVGACTAYWDGVRHDAWMEPARLDLAFMAGFGGEVPRTRVGTHCRRHACAPFESSVAHPEPTIQSLSDHCPVIIDLPIPDR